MLFAVNGVWGQTLGDYRSAATGNWNAIATWERYDGSTWVAAVATPTSADGVITIMSPHVVTISAAGLSYDQVVVDAGGQVTVASTITTTMLNGAGTDLTINGTWLHSGGTWTVTGTTWTVGAGGTYIHNTTSSAATPLGLATLDPASNLIYRGSSTLATAISYSGRTFGNLSFESTSGTWTPAALAGSTASFSTNYTVGSSVSLTMTYTGVFTISGNFTNNGTITYGAGTQNFTFTGSSKTISGSGSISFETFNVSGGASITANNAMTILATFTGTVTGTLATAAVLTNSGTLNVNGIFQLNEGGSLSGTSPVYGVSSTLIYAGTSLQTSSATEFPAASGPNSLTINNSAGVTLAFARTIAGGLTLTSGILNTTGVNLLTVTGTGAGGGGSATSHVNGPLAKTGSTDYQFPIGNGTIYRPISVSSLSGSATITASYTQGNPKTAFGTALAAGIDHIGVCEYWDLDDGASTETGIVALQFGGSCNANVYVNDPATLLVAHWNSGTTQWDNLGNDGSATLTTVKAVTPSTFSPFTIGSSSNTTNPLPVKFSNVKAYQQGSAIKIDWSNLTESNVVNYVVERSANGSSFTALNTIGAARNDGGRADYTSLDVSPLNGVNFYRIRSNEPDGKALYSVIVKVNTKGGVAGITVYPNPVTGGQVSLQTTGLSKGLYTVRIFDAGGQLVFNQLMNHNGGAATEVIELPAALKPGMYSLQLIGGEVKLARSFIIK
jgi:hypothetical protein